MTATSKRRPVDWQPLCEFDPVPGDPEEIRAEVKHMVSVAEKLRDQAKNLKAISDDDTLKGKYVKTLREESSTLEKHMREVASRYERVHGHLTKWSDELEAFQSDADKVLHRAKQRQEEFEAEKAKKSGSGDGETPQASPSGEDHPYEDHLESYRKQLNTIIGDRDSRANHHKDKIRAEIEDVIEDSTWDNVKGWVHDNADLIKAFIDVLGWVATFAGFLALAIPGLNLLVLGIAGLTILLRLALVASGDATWTDVIFDVVGGLLVVGGIGAAAKLASGAKATVNAAQAARTTGLSQGLRGVKGIMDDMGRLMSKMPEGPGRQVVSTARNGIRKSISQNVGLVTKRPLNVSPLSTLLHLGDKEMAGMAKMLQANKAVFPAAAGAAADKAYKSYQLGLGIAWTGMGMDVMDKTLGKSDLTSWTHEKLGTGEKLYNEGYSDWKDNTLKPAPDTHW
ncbi:putative T7SS-secreted protein [Streptomyces albogriseolus]|uniref:putative T7SS-secreted protein n=1 Tax=Streptomyces albogriseolus TaxID=1887 RepID=UPI003D702B46